MDESFAPPVAPQRNLGTRFLYMLLMVVACYVALWVLGFVAILQFALAAFADGPAPRVQAFGASLGRYFGQVTRFLAFDSEDLPFPFADWPQPAA
ncbi:DUF4389 domain-containing protein [Ramlibacter sp. MMS24-I3-19]|uniref:DUF4389 domain-containing protein n=1 Tax=Ramlibacter sp. MMS24-I3-19 TaxID=3416606 RepID=UPI003CFD437A